MGRAYKLNQTFSIKFAKVCFRNMCFYVQRPGGHRFSKRDRSAVHNGRRKVDAETVATAGTGSHKSEYSFSYPLICPMPVRTPPSQLINAVIGGRVCERTAWLLTGRRAARACFSRGNVIAVIRKRFFFSFYYNFFFF